MVTVSMSTLNRRVRKFRYKWNFIPIDIDSIEQDGDKYLLKSPIFATKYNGVTYRWDWTIWKVPDNKQVRTMVYSLDAISNDADCTAKLQIIEDGSIVATTNERSIKTHRFFWPETNSEFALAFNRLYRSNIGNGLNIEMIVDLSLNEDLFNLDSFIMQSTLNAPTIEPVHIEQMLSDVLNGVKCLDYTTIRCDGGEFYVDANFLVKSSEYFASMMSFRLANKQDNKIIDLHQISRARMIDLIIYIYTGRFSLPDDGDFESTKELLANADMLLMTDVKNECARRLTKMLIQTHGKDVCMAADMLIFADKHSLVVLKSLALSMVADRIDELAISKYEGKMLYKLLLKKNDDDNQSLIDQLIIHNAQCQRCTMIDD